MLFSSIFGATTYVHFAIWLSRLLNKLRRSFRIWSEVRWRAYELRPDPVPP